MAMIRVQHLFITGRVIKISRRWLTGSFTPRPRSARVLEAMGYGVSQPAAPWDFRCNKRALLVAGEGCEVLFAGTRHKIEAAYWALLDAAPVDLRSYCQIKPELLRF
jgi:hypothetical protein